MNYHIDDDDKDKDCNYILMNHWMEYLYDDMSSNNCSDFENLFSDILKRKELFQALHGLMRNRPILELRVIHVANIMKIQWLAIELLTCVLKNTSYEEITVECCNILKEKFQKKDVLWQWLDERVLECRMDLIKTFILSSEPNVNKYEWVSEWICRNNDHQVSEWIHQAFLDLLEKHDVDNMSVREWISVVNMLKSHSTEFGKKLFMTASIFLKLRHYPSNLTETLCDFTCLVISEQSSSALSATLKHHFHRGNNFEQYFAQLCIVRGISGNFRISKNNLMLDILKDADVENSRLWELVLDVINISNIGDTKNDEWLARILTMVESELAFVFTLGQLAEGQLFKQHPQLPLLLNVLWHLNNKFSLTGESFMIEKLLDDCSIVFADLGVISESLTRHISDDAEHPTQYTMDFCFMLGLWLMSKGSNLANNALQIVEMLHQLQTDVCVSPSLLNDTTISVFADFFESKTHSSAYVILHLLCAYFQSGAETTERNALFAMQAIVGLINAGPEHLPPVLQSRQTHWDRIIVDAIHVLNILCSQLKPFSKKCHQLYGIATLHLLSVTYHESNVLREVTRLLTFSQDSEMIGIVHDTLLQSLHEPLVPSVAFCSCVLRILERFPDFETLDTRYTFAKSIVHEFLERGESSDYKLLVLHSAINLLLFELRASRELIEYIDIGEMALSLLRDASIVSSNLFASIISLTLQVLRNYEPHAKQLRNLAFAEHARQYFLLLADCIAPVAFKTPLPSEKTSNALVEKEQLVNLVCNAFQLLTLLLTFKDVECVHNNRINNCVVRWCRLWRETKYAILHAAPEGNENAGANGIHSMITSPFEMNKEDLEKMMKYVLPVYKESQSTLVVAKVSVSKSARKRKPVVFRSNNRYIDAALEGELEDNYEDLEDFIVCDEDVNYY